jgi:aminopeptidase N
MRTVGSLLWALLLVGPAVGQQPFNAKKYVVTLEIPDTGNAIEALVTMDFVRRPGSDTLVLNLVGMTVDRVLQYDMFSDPVRRPNDRPFSYDGNVLRIPLLKASVPAGVTIDGPFVEGVSVTYHGRPTDGLIIGMGARGRRVAFGDNWPQRARYWIPSVDEPRDKADVWFTIKAPPHWRVVSNGFLSPLSNDGVWMWAERHPIPTYTMVIGAGEFTVSQHRPVINGRDTIPIEVWTYPEDSAFADSVPFRRATEIVEAMQRLIAPFPYEKLAHVQSSTKFGGMENSSAIFYAEKPYVERKMGEGVVRHETAHQWFGDAVTPRDWPHLWLSEGFATYFDGVIGAALDGDTVLVNSMRANAESYVSSNVTDRPIVDSGYAADPIKLLNANSYPKGAWVLHMLRGTIGDSAFFRGLRSYYRTYRDSTATSEDFQRVIEKAARADLGWFFHQWLYQPGYPQLGVTWHYDAGARKVLLGITQRQKPEWGLFRLPHVTLEFLGANGAKVRREVAVRADSRETTARVDLPFAPTEVRVDPDGKLLLQVTIGRR